MSSANERLGAEALSDSVSLWSALGSAERNTRTAIIDEGWETEDDFRVASCSSSDQDIQEFYHGSVHPPRDHGRADSRGDETLDERETIGFRLDEQDRWLAVHEHLSPVPPPS